MEQRILSNGVRMPIQIMGTSVWDLVGKQNISVLLNKLYDAVTYAIKNDICGFDTGRDYFNEDLLGEIFQQNIKNGTLKRDDLFITTKVGNGQQKLKNMNHEIDESLKALKLDYIDLWMLHWPFPDYYLDNWAQLVDIYKKGKVKSIGIANVRERHILAIKEANLQLPHVIQIEHHPFRTNNALLKMCKEFNIQVEAYSANCCMLPFVRESNVLNKIANKYNHSIAQVMMRWHYQNNVIPIFSSLNPNHIKSNTNIFDFELSDAEMKEIFSLDMDYKFHPESMNCPGY
jgi:Aldo/keto reductases, related to diketogulonate reductase